MRNEINPSIVINVCQQDSLSLNFNQTDVHRTVFSFNCLDAKNTDFTVNRFG